MRITKIEIHDFRCFKDKVITLGEKVTVIAGQNGTGKSTILALLGHCAELKVGVGRPILQRQFRTEFSEIIKSSPEFDSRNAKAFTITLEKHGNKTKKVVFRTGWWERGTRFRIIPRKSTERNTEKKIEWPTLYLGLGRLYPVGESELELKSSSPILSDEEKVAFYKVYKRILSLRDEPIGYAGLVLKGTPKQTLGIRTDKYDATVNSAGQDNLSQIVLAVMSFEKLKKDMGEEWNGGLLLIDELDATLHPVAQNRLMDYLYKSAKKLQIQIAFTTHSLSLLDYVCEKTENNKANKANNYQLVYLTTRNEYLEVLENPTYQEVKNDMLVMTSYLPLSARKMTVYLEDDEARWLFSNICRDFLDRLYLPQVSLGWQDYISLISQDYLHFRDSIFVLDGDVDEESINKKLGGVDARNILRLPGNNSPEQAIFEFLEQLDGQSEFFSEQAATGGITKRVLEERGPATYTQYSKPREQYKQWFKEHRIAIDRAYSFWEISNTELIESFREQFVNTFNEIARYAVVNQIEYNVLNKI